MPRLTRNPTISDAAFHALMSFRMSAACKGGDRQKAAAMRRRGILAMGEMAVPSSHLADTKAKAEAILLLMDLDGVPHEHSEHRRLIRSLAEDVLARGRVN